MEFSTKNIVIVSFLKTSHLLPFSCYTSLYTCIRLKFEILDFLAVYKTARSPNTKGNLVFFVVFVSF